MELHWLKPLLGRPAPFVTVHLDATRADASGDEEVAGRWRSLRRDLERAGAAAGVLDEIEQVVTRPTGVTTPHGRVVIADSRGVVVDRVLKSPPAQSTAVLDDVPVLLPAVRAADEATRFLLVEIDRQGADLTWSDGSGVRGSSKETVEGDHDVLHKVKEGGGTLLDNTLVFAHSETEFAKVHSINNIPMMLAGRAGGRVKSGLYVDGAATPVSRVGLTLQQIMGVPVDRWGSKSMETNKSIGEILA